MKHPFKLMSLLIAMILAVSACGGSSDDTADEKGGVHTLTDMEDRKVEVPRDVDKVVTVGSVPVINGFLFALGEGDVIVNGLPDFARGGRWKYQYVFAPAIEDQPKTQNADGAPLVEDILELEPDVVLTMSPEVVEPLEDVGLTVLVLQWRDATDVKEVVGLLGELLDQEEKAGEYGDYFDATIDQVDEIVGDIPDDERRSALYMSPEAMTRPHLIADWWIDQAGGRSVTEGSTEEVLPLNIEQIIDWDPEVIFVSSPDEVEAIYDDERFEPVTAVAEREVYSVPIAAHTWGNRTSEQPLTVYWTASKLYPDLVTEDDVIAEVEDFYSTFFATELTADQAAEIVSGQ